METETQGGKNLFSKIAAIKGEVKRLKKTGFNKHQNYPFATNGDVYDLIRILLAEHNVALFPEVIAYEVLPQSKGYHAILQMRFTFACGDTGQTFACLWAGESSDFADKSFNKAMTAGTKYFLLSAFLISTGDENEDADSQSPSQNSSNADASKSAKPQSPHVVPKTASDGVEYTGDIVNLDIRADKNNKPFVSADGITFYTRDVFRELGYEKTLIDKMAIAGTSVKLSDPVQIAYKIDGKFKTPVKVHRAKTQVTIEMANLPKKKASGE